MKKIVLASMVTMLFVGCGDSKYTYEECQEESSELQKKYLPLILEAYGTGRGDQTENIRLSNELQDEYGKLKYDHGCQF